MAEEALVSGERIVDTQWELVCNQLKMEFGETAFDSWLKPLKVGEFNNGVLDVCAPTIFMKNWVVTHYSDRIHKIWEKQNPDIKNVNFIVGRHTSDTSLLKSVTSFPTPQGVYANINSSSFGLVSGANLANDPAKACNTNTATTLNPNYTFENFVVDGTNQFAYAAAKKVAESKSVSFNPLFLYSNVGLGKTHLMNSIIWHLKENDPKRNVVYLTAEQFVYKFLKALRYKDTAAFKEQFRSVDVLMVDDFQFMGSKGTSQEEFFHTLNSLVAAGKQVIISADRSPTDLDGIEDRLRSRLVGGLVVDIMPTSLELRMGILKKKAELLGIDLPIKVAEFLAQKITSNVRELEGSLTRIAAHSQLLSDKEITLDMTQDVLKDMLRSIDRKTTIDEIQKKVAEYFNISVKELQSSRRARTVARPRQIAMYLAKQLTSRSLPEIGRKFDRDHTTVMHAVRKVEELIVEDQSLAENIEVLRKTLEN